MPLSDPAAERIAEAVVQPQIDVLNNALTAVAGLIKRAAWHLATQVPAARNYVTAGAENELDYYGGDA